MIRTAPQWSHVSRCPPSAAVRQAAIARRARCWTAREPMRATIGLAVRAHDVRELEPRTGARDRRARWHGAHGSALRRRGEAREQIERRVGADLACAASIESSASSCVM